MRAFLFDFDGVVVESEPLHLETFREVLEPLGIEIDEGRWYREFIGTGSPHIIKTLLAEVGITDEKTREEYVIKRRDIYRKRIEDGYLKEKKGFSAFAKLSRDIGIKTGVVSGGHRTNILSALSKLGLQEYFDVVVGREDYDKRKPDPECYIIGAKKIGSKIEECAAFEDSISGCRSAQRAGMKLIVIEPVVPVKLEGCKPAIRVKNFMELNPEDVLRLLSSQSD